MIRINYSKNFNDITSGKQKTEICAAVDYVSDEI